MLPINTFSRTGARFGGVAAQIARFDGAAAIPRHRVAARPDLQGFFGPCFRTPNVTDNAREPST